METKYLEVLQHGDFIQNLVKNIILLVACILGAILWSLLPLITNCASVSTKHHVDPGSFSEHFIPSNHFKK